MPDICILQPPTYETALRPAGDISRLSGVVVRVRFALDELTPETVEAVLRGIARLGRLTPRAPVIVTVSRIPPSLDAGLLKVLRRLDCSAVVPDSALSLDVLRAQLADSTELLDDVLKWFASYADLQLAGTTAARLLEAGLHASPAQAMPPPAGKRYGSV